MGATALEFRLRMVINAAIIVLGICAPWIAPERRVLVLEWLPLELARLHAAPFSTAVSAVLVITALIAALGVLLRVSGTAYLGPAIVNHLDMKASSVMAAGPYRYLRNPLYVGLWCMAVGIALLMPPSGAAVSLILLGIFLVRLTLGEEAFLTVRLHDSYHAYIRAVPRFLPRLRSNLPAAATRPEWVRALLAELTPISVFIGVVSLWWSYDARLMGRIILIGFGLSLIVRALMPQRTSAGQAAR